MKNLIPMIFLGLLASGLGAKTRMLDALNPELDPSLVERCERILGEHMMEDEHTKVIIENIEPFTDPILQTLFPQRQFVRVATSIIMSKEYWHGALITFVIALDEEMDIVLSTVGSKEDFATLLKAENIQMRNAGEAAEVAKAYATIYRRSLSETPTVTKNEDRSVDFFYQLLGGSSNYELRIRTDEAGSVLENETRLIASNGIAAPTPVPPFVESVPIE